MTIKLTDRILGFFPPEKHGVILNHLSFHITCFVVQKLLVKKDGKTLVPAFEILLGDPMVRNLIAKNEFEKIPQAMRNANQQGMQTMDQALFALWKDGNISQEEALAVSEKPQDLEQNFKGISIDSQNARILGA